MSARCHLFEVVGTETLQRKIEILIPNGFAVTPAPALFRPCPAGRARALRKIMNN
jgi:hypothetical protein